MTEKEYLELLKELKLPANRSYQQILDLLETVINDYLDRQDDAMVARITEAEEYVEEQMKLLGTGITIVEKTEPQENTEVDLESLKGQQRTGGAQQFRASGTGPGTAGGAGGTGTGSTAGGNGAYGQTAGTAAAGGVGSSSSAGTALWFTSLTGNAAVNNMFIQAVDCMKYEQWNTAERIFDTIAGQEGRNASVYLGKCLVNFQLKDPREIAVSEQNMEQDVNFCKARDFGNNLQKKFLEDALEEKSKFLIYKDAYRKLQEKKNGDELSKAANAFMGISGYRDADQLRDQCLALILQVEKSNLLSQIQSNIKEIQKQAKEDKADQFNRAVQKFQNSLKELKKRKQNSKLTSLYADVDEKQLDEEVKKIINQRFRRKNRGKMVSVLLVVITLLIGPAPYAEDGDFDIPWIPISIFDKDVDINGSSTPFLISLGRVERINLYQGNVGKYIMPFSRVEFFWASDCDGESLAFPENVDKIDIGNMPKVQKLEIPEGVREVKINDFSRLKELVIPDSVEILTIYNCPALEELEIPDSVRELTVEGCEKLE